MSTVIPETDYGWLSPRGQFYPCGYCEHAEVAYELCRETYGSNTVNPMNCSAQRFLIANGWLHISIASFGGFDGRKPTHQQEMWLNEWIADHPKYEQDLVSKLAVLKGQVDCCDVPTTGTTLKANHANRDAN